MTPRPTAETPSAAGRGAALLVLLAGLLPSASARAQVQLHLDAAMGDARELRGANVAIAPAGSWTGRWWQVEGRSRYTAAGEHGEALQSAITGLAWRRLTPTLSLTAGVTGQQRSLSWDRDAAGWGALVGLSLESLRRGARLSLLRGAAQRLDGHVPLSQAEGTAWARLGLIRIEILGRQTTLAESVPGVTTPRDSGEFGGGTRNDSTPAQQFTRYTDLGGTASGTRGPVSASLSIGHRFSPFGGGAWWRAEGLWWLSQRLGLVMQGGRNPPDLMLGTGGGRFFTLAFRASLKGPTTLDPVRPPPPIMEGRTLLLTRRPGGGTTLSLHAPTSRRVELMADFTDWLPVELVPREEGWFDLLTPVPSGSHPVNVRYDGGAWTPPPGSPTMRDEFGGVVGVVRVE